ncbi:MAG: MotA/TolQ/ExbB proton channel family protein [Verrucomicrobia bacterium]|nr:MAG: MotA/TolQ/ExbB proton channel family protein [Verrucomicrobiota bacterium]
MSPRSLFIILALCSSAIAQTPSLTADADLKKAVAQLTEKQRETSDLRRNLYREINLLDDEALKLGTELRELQREEERRTATQKTLEREVEARKVDFNYSSGILTQYAKALLTRLHPAETQLYQQSIEQSEQRANAATDDPTQEITQRLEAVTLGLDRLEKVAGGHRFEGTVLRNGSEAIKGNILLAGPAVFFSATDGSFDGVATFAETGTALPTVVALEDDSHAIKESVKNGYGLLPLDGTMGKAIEVAAAEESLLDTIKKGGIVGHAILLLGAISFSIAIFKVWEISRIRVPSRNLINEILDDLLVGKQDQAIRKAEAISGPAGAIVQTGTRMFFEKRRVLEEALFEKLVAIKPRMDRFIPFLALTAAAGPLMGLLGTVLGIIKTFQAMALYGTGNAKNFSAGISEALITTAEGLIVAIPVLVIHGLLKSHIKGRFSELEGIGIAMINGTTERERRNEKAQPSKVVDASDDGDDDIELKPTLA